MKFSKAIPVMLALAAGWPCAHAAADFTTILGPSVSLTDSSPTLVQNFTLPSNVNRSLLVAYDAVLDFEVEGSTYDYNEVYINPPWLACYDETNDPNHSASIGRLQEHDDTYMKYDWAANHIAFPSTLLHATISANNNTVMICIRGVGGAVTGELDNVNVRSMVLHYHTTQ